MIFRSSIFRHGNFRDGNQLHIIHSTYTSSVTSPGCTSFPLWYLLGYQLGQVLLQIQALHSCPVSKEKRLEMYCMLKLEISSYIYTRRDFFSIVQSPLLTDCEESYFQLTSLLLHLWSQEKKMICGPKSAGLRRTKPALLLLLLSFTLIICSILLGGWSQLLWLLQVTSVHTRLFLTISGFPFLGEWR